MRALAIALGAFLSTLAASEARAACSYDGVDDAKTTVAREFKDSRLVVRAKVLAASDHISDEDESWTLYRLEVRRAYKGSPPQELRVFTFRNSGGFYMDRPWVKLPAGHDIGGEYLLFLNPIEPFPDQPAAAEGGFSVNYSCGVSGPWAKVSATSRRKLLALGR